MSDFREDPSSFDRATMFNISRLRRFRAFSQMPIALIKCRYCGKELSFHTKAAPFSIQVPCHGCRYITVVESSVMELPNHRFLSRPNPPDFGPTDDSRAIGAYLHNIAGDLLDAAIVLVQVELPVARNSLVSVFSRRERHTQERISRSLEFDPSWAPRFFPKVAGLLWGVLSHVGGSSSDVIRNFSSKGVSRFLGRFEPIAAEIVTIAAFANSIRRGELTPSFDGSQFKFIKSSRHTAAVESMVNRKQQERDTLQFIRPDEAFSKEALEAQQLVLGFNADEITKLALNCFEQLRSHTEVESERNLYWIRMPPKGERLHRLISACTATLSRLCEFRSPLFFDLGERADPPMSERDAILNAAAVDWSGYYPFSSMLETNGEPDLVLTSRGIMTHFLTGLVTQKNTVMEQLRLASGRSGNPQLASRVAALVEQGSHALEASVCGVARSVGWQAIQTAPSLPCGDIDALLARPLGEDEVLVVLCEIKDADLPAHRGDAYESQARVVGKALKQLDSKAKWVATNWSGAFGASNFPGLGDRKHGFILKVLVTRSSCPMELMNGAECVPIPALKRFFSDLKNGFPSWFEGTRSASIHRF